MIQGAPGDSVGSRPETEQGGSADMAGRTAIGDSSTPPGDTQPASSSIDPLVGRVLSHYRLEERLGAGGMGMLYRATDLSLGRAAAVKLLAGISSATKPRRLASFERRALRVRWTIPTSALSTRLGKQTASCSLRWRSTRAKPSSSASTRVGSA